MLFSIATLGNANFALAPSGFATEDNGSSGGDSNDDFSADGMSSDGTVLVHIDSKVPMAGQELPLNIQFKDANGEPLRRINYAITVTQDNNAVFSDPKEYRGIGTAEYTTSALGSDNPVFVQITILGIGRPYHEDTWTGPIGEVITIQIGDYPHQVLSVWTDSMAYHLGSTVTVTANLSILGAGQYIAIGVTNPAGEDIVARTLVTDDYGNVYLVFTIPQSYQIGTYYVVATAFVDDTSIRADTTFTVENQFVNFEIISVQATDQDGNPVSSFDRGTTGYAKVVIATPHEQEALVTVNLFDSNSASLGVGSVKTTLGIGQSEMIVSFYILGDAATGTATLFANAFSDWPSQGGVPLTGEVASYVEIQ